MIRRTPIRRSSKAKERARQVKELDALVKQLIVAERGYKCERCGKTIEQEPIHAAHIKSKGPYRRIRFEKDNILLLCYRDHLEFAHKEPDDFIQWVEQKWPGRLEQLRIMAATSRKTDYKELLIGLRLEVAQCHA